MSVTRHLLGLHAAYPCPAPGTTTFTVDLGFGVVVRQVPALVCSLCGEFWIEDPVAARLERVVEEARRKHSPVEVTHWDQLAA